MLFFMVLLIVCNITPVTNKNAGSAIFYNVQTENKKCWHKDEISKLQARKVFEDIIPPPVKPENVNSRYVKELLKYFKNSLVAVDRGVDHNTGKILKEALSDTIGAHLRSEILPAVRFAYYAGYVPYKNAKQIDTLYEQIKINLNTQGVGWKQPAKIPEWSNLTVVRILIGSTKFSDPCDCLVVKRDENNCVHLPSPKLDDKQEPSAIALPFKTQGLVGLMSPKSENILLKYYTAASRCILDSSPANCRHADFVNFNNELWHWMKREVAPHLLDEKLFAAYGGVLRIAAAVQNYGKGLSRRNLFEFPEPYPVYGWNPWKKLTESYVYINADWTPGLYVSLVILTALTIYLLQFCYNYMFGDANACNCRSAVKKSYSKEVAYSKVDSNFPSVLPQQNEFFYNHEKRVKRGRSQSSSLASARTQKVYDLNENAEKMMAVIISSNEDSDRESAFSKPESEEECDKSDRPKSPPKIETTIAQLKLDRPHTPRSEKKVSVPMYSTSTLTRSEATFRQAPQLTDSAWSASSSSTSGKSVTSTSSKSHTHRSRSSRDLAWARHVISRHSRGSRSGRVPGGQSSGTEFDAQSFTTPPSRR